MTVCHALRASEETESVRNPGEDLGALLSLNQELQETRSVLRGGRRSLKEDLTTSPPDPHPHGAGLEWL